MEKLPELARSVAEALESQAHYLVLAESCTGGLAAASMTGVPRISAHFCGATVVYRERTKTEWLGVPVEVLTQFSAESAETTECLSRSVLLKTPEATVAAAVTGHLGPDAPVNDGVVYFSVARRARRNGPDTEIESLSHEVQLQSTGRISRQQEATAELLGFLLRTLTDR
jgi:nicotinamide-nucleotide amidase